MKICIWDDDVNAADEWKSALQVVLQDSGAQIHAVKADEIEGELEVLHERRKSLTDSGEDASVDQRSELDDTDILIVDNDLFDLPRLSDVSAETVANRAGVYTECACIVVLNLDIDVDFDLTLLGHPESKADFHINDKFVADLGLWLHCPRDGGTFRPWHWPLLLSAVALYKSRVEDLVKLLESDEREMPILDYLGFGDGAKRRLSRSARAFLHPKKPAEKTTFMDFIDGNAKAVSQIDAEQILARRDVRKIARIGARRISKWLAHYILGPQDVLVDLPHLVEKMPFVVPEEERSSVEFWNSCARLDQAPVWLAEELRVEPFSMGNWFDRPVFWTDGIETEENLERLLAATNANPDGLVFCEDASAFHDAEVCEQFVAGHNAVSDSRFIRWLKEEGEEIRYGPQSRLAM